MNTLGGATEVARGIYRCGSERVNWYLVREDGRFTVVDAGFPAHYPQLLGALEALGAEVDDIEGCLLTHAHPDHIGFAERLRTQIGVPVRLHPSEIQRARDGGDPPLGGFLKNLWRPAVLAYFVEVARSKGISVPGVTSAEKFEDGAEVDVPGRPQVIHVPGHTEGEVAFYLPEREVLFCGDALATVEFETWRGHEPQLLPEWINEDHARARRSLDRLEGLGEVGLLPGHGPPWTGPMEEAVFRAQTT
jgi:glyoxylase-like metal-dependent hydrolase (beta-lactamase superfamily II)